MKEADKRLIALESLLIKKGIITDEELQQAYAVWDEIEEKEEHP
jgi:hypothetical protein